MHELLRQFRAAIRAAGIEPPDVIEADGTLHRFATNGKCDDDAGWYVLYSDGIPAGCFGDWRTDLFETWCAKAHQAMSDAERHAHRQRIEKARAEAAAERVKVAREAQEKCGELWSMAAPVLASHPYVARKGIKPAGAKQLHDMLVIPLRDAAGVLRSLQFIQPDGSKRFKAGGTVAGCYCPIGGEPMADKPLLVAEGWATACSLHEATGYPVAAAMSAGNLPAVAKSLRAKLPDVLMILCADDDIETEGNPGLTKAREVALGVGARLAVPGFGPERPKGATDFNDLHVALGAGAVLACIEGAVTPECDGANSPPPEQDACLFLSYEELCSRFSPARWLVKDLIPADATGILFGESGTYKSFVALDLAFHVAHGLQWCGRKTRQGAVFYIAGEAGGGMQHRIQAWHEHYNFDPHAAPFRICPVPLALNHLEVAASVKADINRSAAEVGKPQLIFVDTLSQNYDGDENDNSEMASFFRNLITDIRAHYPGCTIVIIHHTGQASKDRARGSYAITANTDFIYQVQGADHTATLTCKKMKDAEPAEPLVFELDEVDLGVDEDDDPVSSLAAAFKETSPCQPRDGHKKPRRHSKHGAVLISVLRDLPAPTTEIELREAFCRACNGTMKPDAKRQAFKRALDAALADRIVVRQLDGSLSSQAAASGEA